MAQGGQSNQKERKGQANGSELEGKIDASHLQLVLRFVIKPSFPFPCLSYFCRRGARAHPFALGPPLSLTLARFALMSPPSGGLAASSLGLLPRSPCAACPLPPLA